MASTPSSNKTTPSKSNASANPTRSSGKTDWVSLFQTLHFAWFLGHVLTLLGGLGYLLTIRSSGAINSFFYNAVFVGAVESFGVLLFQSYGNKSLSLKPLDLLALENVQYFAIAALFLTILPHIAIAVVPFTLFSVFHALSYTRSNILPLLNIPATATVSSKIADFVKTYNDKSLFLVSNFEFFTLTIILIKALLFRKGYWIAAVIYTVFFKLRFEKSIFLRSVVKSWEARIDGLVSHPSLSVAVKSNWVQVKKLIRTYGGKPILATTASGSSSSNPSTPQKNE
ncbi:BA75_04780T0 [Komagataella pastoris]|uniref:BA75_04780T0 n=1 Tax=Komagataella pastoris TaxID=4922 RepID=A0A1B2JIK9_PICPA|nr:BA75_04780T0 [Komagataella pastoris]